MRRRCRDRREQRQRRRRNLRRKKQRKNEQKIEKTKLAGFLTFDAGESGAVVQLKPEEREQVSPLLSCFK